MKQLFSILLISLFTTPLMWSQSTEKWILKFEDHFNGGTFNPNNWEYCVRRSPDWSKYLKSSTDVVKVENGLLKLRTIKNTTDHKDEAPYFTGGIQSRGKVSFRYGKIEVRAKFAKSGQGSFPAIWLMPENQILGWPKDGEMDIMERLNAENQIYQTIHSHYVTNLKIKDNPKYFSTTPINPNIFNIYGLEWYEDRLDFTINGKITFTYPRIITDKELQWPFDKEFYIILNQAAGGSWGGAITDSHLPFEMQIDWVKIYNKNPNAPYEIPQWSGDTPQNNPKWNDTFIKEIAVNNTTNNYPQYKVTQRPNSFYVQHVDTIIVEQGKDFSIQLKAHSLGAYTTKEVLQDLRYTAAYIYTDYDGDKVFETNPTVIGNQPPKDAKGGNIEVLDITQTFNAPVSKTNQIGRIRIIYHNAWDKRLSPNSPVREGVAHDFIVKSTIPSEIANISPINTYPITIKRRKNDIQIAGLTSKSIITIYDISGKIIDKKETSQSEIVIKKPTELGVYILKVNNSLGLHSTIKI